MLSWKDLTKEEQDSFLNSPECNGCWGKGGFIKPPLRAFFKASCNIHDWWYYVGGTELDRKERDLGFLKYMKQDCLWIRNLAKRYFFLMWAYLYYFAVRQFGWKYFNYNK